VKKDVLREMQVLPQHEALGIRRRCGIGEHFVHGAGQSDKAATNEVPLIGNRKIGVRASDVGMVRNGSPNSCVSLRPVRFLRGGHITRAERADLAEGSRCTIEIHAPVSRNDTSARRFAETPLRVRGIHFKQDHVGAKAMNIKAARASRVWPERAAEHCGK